MKLTAKKNKYESLINVYSLITIHYSYGSGLYEYYTEKLIVPMYLYSREIVRFLLKNYI
jgi:hypothetical protein